MYRADEYWRNRRTESGEEVAYTIPVASYIVYGLILVSLIIFAVVYPVTTFSLGNASVTFYAVPVGTVLFALFGWLGLRKSFHFFILSILAFTVILSAAIVVGLAGGIIQILQDGRIIDPILHALASLMNEAGRVASVGAMYVIQTLINIIIPSGSAKAALTMPIMAPFSDVIGISRQATVMAFQFGDGFTNMITPTSAVLIGALGIARIPYEVWVKWFAKILLLFVVLGFLLLIPTVVMQLPGF